MRFLNRNYLLIIVTSITKNNVIAWKIRDYKLDRIVMDDADVFMRGI